MRRADAHDTSEVRSSTNLGEAELRSAVVGILDAAPMAEESGLRLEIRQLNTIRSAAHRVLEDDVADPEAKASVIRDLRNTAMGTELPDWALATIEEEVDLHTGRQPQPRLGSYVQAAQALRRLGYGRCPICQLDVLSEVEIAHYQQLDQDWLATEARHAQAVAP